MIVDKWVAGERQGGCAAGGVAAAGLLCAGYLPLLVDQGMRLKLYTHNSVTFKSDRDAQFDVFIQVYLKYMQNRTELCATA